MAELAHLSLSLPIEEILSSVMAAHVYIATSSELGFFFPTRVFTCEHVCSTMPTGVRDNIKVVLICISLMIKNVEPSEYFLPLVFLLSQNVYWTIY